MNTTNCPSCGKPNPDTVDICQYCGTALKKNPTVPLPPIHPGDMPVKKKTSDLESTLPGWLRDVRRASSEAESASESKPEETPPPAEPVAPAPEKPAPPKQKESASPLDFLAGLSQANDEEEDVPDWLKSLQSSMPAAAEPAPAPEPPSEKPADWLSGLQSEAQELPAASEPDWGFGDQPVTFNFDENADTTTPISQDTPDWLSALKAQADETAHPAAPSETLSAGQAAEGQPSSDETPDWLAALSDTSIGTVPAQSESRPVEPQPASSDDTPDWLSSLGESSGILVEQTPAESAPTAETPDWLSSLGESSSAQTHEQIPAKNAPADETPDWLAAISETDTAAAPSQPESRSVEPQPAPSDDTPDWLASLGESSNLQAEQISLTNAPDVETPDWLAALSETDTAAAPSQLESNPEQQQPVASDDTLDWLSSLGGDFNAEETPASFETSEQSAADTSSDWLANLGSELGTPGESVTSEPAASESLPAADLPPWLSDLSGASQPAESQVAQPASEKETTLPEPQPAASDIPDWMADLQGPSITAAEIPVSQEPGTAEVPASADIPDWMAGLSAESQPTVIPEPASTSDSELPPWLASAIGEKPAEKPVEPASPRKPFDTGALRELKSLEGVEELPDWMANLGRPSETSKPVEASSGEIGTVSPIQPEPTPFEAAPASAESSVSPVFGEEQNLESLLSMDMPDWLSGFTPTEAELSAATPTEKPEEDNIRPADLPSWVQAMRPVEDVMGEKLDEEEEEQQVESSGPLAGLRSVLPAQLGLPGVHKPKSYSIKLQVDETQKAQATLLENILNSESMPQAALQKPEALVIRPLRWVIAGVLLVTVLFGALLQDMLGSPVFPSPDMSAGHSQINTFKEIIDNLADNATVLVVVDYQPGFAGEMEPSAGPVISQLMGKNTRLAFISTSPAGSYMAEHLLQKFTKKYPYELGTQYVNLGYLPGGAGGIQVFAELPGTTVGKDWFLGNLWEKDALKSVTVDNVTKLSNFSAILVLTDNPDTGRLWIEQAEPSLRPKPMLMVISAQAEPMIRPYLASGQLKGMISGLEDGTLYENLLANPGQARSYWDAFGVAVIAAELLIIVGGVWGLVAGSRARRAKKMEQDEA